MATLMKDVKVVSVEYADEIIDIGAAAAKALPPGRRYRYARKHVFVLENGERVNGEAHGDTKPKLAKAVEREQGYVRDGCLFCSQYQNTDGEVHWYTITRVCISLR